MAQHGHGALADLRVVLRSDQAAEKRRDAQSCEIASRNEQRLAALRLAAVGKIRLELVVTGELAEHGLPGLEVSEHR
jgi:hypothetical protein